MDKEMFSDPRFLTGPKATIVSVVTCTRCGCIVVDADIHEMFHKNHGHAAYGFTTEWTK